METPGMISHERWTVLSPLLDVALDLEPAARDAYLAETCGGDGALIAELTTLIHDCENAESLLGSPAAVAFAPLLYEPPIVLPPLLDGRYHIVREIGRGGMATVYLADDPKHSRQVAIKVLHADVARAIGRERFLREIEIAAGLSHPHVLPLHDSGEIESQQSNTPSILFFVSPFVAGESLRDRLKREKQLSVDEAVHLGREIALALDYAHRQGVVHLDIKPENILLQEGHAVIADFGIARAITGSNSRAFPGALPILGTPAYMSPEQSQSDQEVDGRSDVYSLGCVLYEMITGARAFDHTPLSPTVSRARAQLNANSSVLQQRVPTQLSSVILRAMASNRDDRYSSAGDFARALDIAAQPRTASPWRQKRALIAYTVMAVLAAVATFFATRTNSELDANLIAVAPFDVAEPSLVLWKEGLADVMSRNLDGAGPLRTVPVTTVLRRWGGRADAEAARALGARTGAKLVLFGGLLSAGDSVRATAVLLDASTGNTIAEIERRDVAGRIDRLSDSLTVAVLHELSHTRRVDMERVTSWPTTSIAALKAYLQGEQFYRAALWDSAGVHFERALTLDTTFALAYHRLAAVRKLRDLGDIPDSTPYALMRRTSRFPKGLAPRERILASVDSLRAKVHFAFRRAQENGHDEEEAELGTKLVEVLSDGVLRYPRDPELWFLLADARSEFDVDEELSELDDREILGLYDRAIALDSGFAPAYVKPIVFAAYLDGPAAAQRYINAYLSIDPNSIYSKIIRLDDVLLDPKRSAQIDVARLIDTLPPEGLCEATKLLRHIPDSTEIVVRIGEELATRRLRTSASTSLPTCGFLQAVDGLQFRGHLRAAHRIASAQAHWLRPSVMFNMAQFNMLPIDSTRAEFQRILSYSAHAQVSRLYGWWAVDGDTAAIQTYVDVFSAPKKSRRSPALIARGRAEVSAGRAYLALAKHDSVSALRQLMATQDTPISCWYDNRLQTVQLLIAANRLKDAAHLLERRWPGASGCGDGFVDVEWTMERARVFDKLGRRGDAVLNYAFVAAAWRSADAELQPVVREAKAALARLSDKPRN